MEKSLFALMIRALILCQVVTTSIVAFDLNSISYQSTSNLPDMLRSSHTPLPGSIYQSALSLPVLGKQIFQLHIFERKRAQLTIKGMMAVDAIVDYDVCERSGAVLFELPEKVVKMLRRFRTKLVEAYYEPSSDLVHIKVRPPLPTNINLLLSRQQ